MARSLLGSVQVADDGNTSMHTYEHLTPESLSNWDRSAQLQHRSLTCCGSGRILKERRDGVCILACVVGGTVQQGVGEVAAHGDSHSQAAGPAALKLHAMHALLQAVLFGYSNKRLHLHLTTIVLGSQSVS